MALFVALTAAIVVGWVTYNGRFQRENLIAESAEVDEGWDFSPATFQQIRLLASPKAPM